MPKRIQRLFKAAVMSITGWVMAGYGTEGAWSSPSQLLITPVAPRSDELVRGTPGFRDLQGHKRLRWLKW